jgi:hypothetical protein
MCHGHDNEPLTGTPGLTRCMKSHIQNVIQHTNINMNVKLM